jgi:hypothetical protein
MRNVRKIENSLMRHPHSWQHCQRRSQPLFLEPLISKTNLNPLQASFHAAEHGLSIYYIRSRKSLHTLRYWTPFRKLFHVELREIRLDFLILPPRHLPIYTKRFPRKRRLNAPLPPRNELARIRRLPDELIPFPLERLSAVSGRLTHPETLRAAAGARHTSGLVSRVIVPGVHTSITISRGAHANEQLLPASLRMKNKK